MLLVLQLALGLVYLKTVPRFFNDEAWEASIGHSLAAEGSLRHGIIEGWGGMHVKFVQNQVVLPFVTAAIYRVAGFGIVTSRLASVLMSLLAVAGVYGAMRRWFGDTQGFWISLATVLHPWFFEISRRVRPEIYFIALAMAAVWCWLHPARRAAWPAAAGLLAGLAGLAHPTGLVLVFAVGAAMLICRRRPGRGRACAWAAAGFVLAVAPYVLYVLHATADPRVSFFVQMGGGKGILTACPAAVLAGELKRWGSFFRWPTGAPLAALLLLAWLAAWWRSSRADKTIATAVVLFAAAMPFTTVNLTSRYLIALVPLLAALLVRLVVRLAGAEPQRRPWRVACGLAAALLYAGMGAGAISLMLWRLRSADLTRPLDRVARVTGREGRVFGEMVFWMGRERYRYGPFPLRYDGKWIQTVEMVRRHRFDYAVRTAWWFSTSHGVADPPQSMPADRPARADRVIDEVCRRYGTKVAEFRDRDFGPIEVYRLNWDDPAPP